MRKLIIDRLEGIYAICEDENQKYYAIELSELPKGAKAGDVLAVNDEEGTLSVDAEASAARKKKAK